ncbi:unnamed protein product [Cunninghamella blakesleeana]
MFVYIYIYIYYSFYFLYYNNQHCQRLSKQFFPLTKESTLAYTENASTSHAYLLQGGFIRQSSSGIFSLLPMGLRVIEKIEAIIDEEMKAIGSQKLKLPLLLHSDHWKSTGRWDTSKGEFFRLKDRKEIDMLLAPTHEEEITTLVASELRSSKQLPIRLYQVGRKYRDELRPRAGLLRGREFIMKDLYSFDKSVEDAFITYDHMAQAYTNIFNRIGVPFVVAEADSGNIGGSKSHEYHLISTVGEDTLLTCQQCGYTANEELAEGIYKTNHPIDTNNNNNNKHVNSTLEILNLKSSLSSSDIHLSTLSFNTMSSTIDDNNNDNGDKKINGLAVVITPKDRKVNHLRVHSVLGSYLEKNNTIHDRATLELNPIPLDQWISTYQQTNKINDTNVHVFLDNAIHPSLSFSAIPSITLHPPHHFRLAEAGDACQHCHHHSKASSLESVKSIEVGHTFYLGTKYSSVLGCQFQDHSIPSNNNNTSHKQNEWKFAEMGCYGIGISRLLASVAESRTDDRGLVWPASIAPYKICIITTDDKKEAFKTLSNTIYDQLNMKKTRKEDDIIIDDRSKMGFGRKMTDAELIGYPWIIVIGRKALDPHHPKIEIHQRTQHQPNKTFEIPLNEFDQWISTQLN